MAVSLMTLLGDGDENCKLDGLAQSVRPLTKVLWQNFPADFFPSKIFFFFVNENSSTG